MKFINIEKELSKMIRIMNLMKKTKKNKRKRKMWW